MIVPDVNLLLFAYNKDHRCNKAAVDWLSELLSGPETVGFAWSVLWSFVRLMGSSNVVVRPAGIEQTFPIVESWLARQNVTVLGPGPGHLKLVQELLQQSGGGPRLVFDAHLAALAIENDGTIHSDDMDFSRFGDLSFSNPLAPQR